MLAFNLGVQEIVILAVLAVFIVIVLPIIIGLWILSSLARKAREPKSDEVAELRDEVRRLKTEQDRFRKGSP